MFELRDSAEVDSSLIKEKKTAYIASLTAREQELLESLSKSSSTKHRKELKKIRRKLNELENQTESIYLPIADPTVISTAAQPNCDSVILNGLNIPKCIWERLFEHQKAAVEWLHQLYTEQKGGILADDMGLGKTIEIIAFLESLRYSGLLKGPVLLLAPTTIITQWIAEFSKWAPAFMLLNYRELQGPLPPLFEAPIVVISSYEILHTKSKKLLNRRWFYFVLDEGHKIKNPEAKITHITKEFFSHYKLLLSGTPIQNSLLDLWSLIDFVCPGHLGALSTFDSEISSHISRAGLSCASKLEVELGYQCAVKLQEIVSPYIFRRTKKQVDIQIPKYDEKVLYCELTESQWEIYCHYASSCHRLTEKTEIFRAIKDLRFICNHPSLLKTNNIPATATSGKLVVLQKILALWQEEERSILIFSQYKKMLSLVERMCQGMALAYERMDGDVPILERPCVLNLFNSGQVPLLLLTTKVGGLGLNLPRANRVIILDPDWNPMNDTQAKERALRIGQHRKVKIYRFITKFTIEEKIYQRQVYKLTLANRVLRSPEQKAFSTKSSCADLFELPPAPKASPEHPLESSPIPQCSKKENSLIKRILEPEDIEEYDEDSLLKHMNVHSLLELNAMKRHARK